MCRDLNPVEYYEFQRIRREILPQATVREAVHTLIRLASSVAQDEPGRERLRELHAMDDVAPSERLSVISPRPASRPEPAGTAMEGSRAEPASPPRVTITLRHRHSVNGAIYGPGASVDVPAELTSHLLMADRRADEVGV